MRTRLLLISILVASLTANASRAYDPAKGIPARQFKIAGITIGALQEQIEKVFGRPINYECQEKPTFCLQECSAQYEGVSVSYCEGKAVGVHCNSPKYSTPKGVRVGMSIEEVYQRQGRTEVISGNSGEWLSYSLPKRDCALRVHIVGGKVIEIELWFDFT